MLESTVEDTGSPPTSPLTTSRPALGTLAQPPARPKATTQRRTIPVRSIAPAHETPTSHAGRSDARPRPGIGDSRARVGGSLALGELPAKKRASCQLVTRMTIEPSSRSGVREGDIADLGLDPSAPCLDAASASTANQGRPYRSPPPLTCTYKNATAPATRP